MCTALGPGAWQPDLHDEQDHPRGGRVNQRRHVGDLQSSRSAHDPSCVHRGGWLECDDSTDTVTRHVIVGSENPSGYGTASHR